MGFEGSLRFGVGGDSPLSRVQAADARTVSPGSRDVIVANVGGNEPGLDHPAVFPSPLPSN